jgi:DNA topoisomerase-1
MHISPKETMKCCQTLYEAGYITYMRTDSKKYSSDFIDTVKKYIVQKYNDGSYISPHIDSLSNSCTDSQSQAQVLTTEKEKGPEKLPEKKQKKPKQKEQKEQKKGAAAQEAHEAIRPTNILTLSVPDDMTPREKKLYGIIWNTTMESCMSAAEYLSFKNHISTHVEGTRYSCSSEIQHFLGWKIIRYKKDSEKESEKEYHFFQQLKSNRDIEYIKITSKCVLKNQKQHYTEAKLVQLLEECGIGRPSTFSTLVDKIQERGYVKKQDVEGKAIQCKEFELDEDTITETNVMKEFGCEKNKLIIQPVGILVIEFLVTHFESILNYDYTKNMEDELDKVCKNEIVWHEICRKCLDELNQLCDTLIKEKKESKIEIKIDDRHTYIIGKHGPVIKCIDTDNEYKSKSKKDTVSFLPVCENIDLKKLERGEYTLQEVIAQKKITQMQLGVYQSHPLFIKTGKYGLYTTWGESSKSLTCFGNRPMENIKLEDVIKVIEESVATTTSVSMKSSGIIRFLSNEISIRQGKYGDYIFYKTAKMKKPLFLKLDNFQEDYKTCTNHCFMEWFKREHIAS